ncbi:MAG TPA: FG-GAP-like repeat-containing protein [Steroidobacteraceae bacterium]|jgi:hypothetical protein|nr:FG-GAP-like repeat-containing protein [Steroidobacteraceae bacterium]
MKFKFPRRAALLAGAIIIGTAIAVVSSSQTQLQFLGMNTVFGLNHAKSGLLRQADCSITQYGFSFSTRALLPATNFENTLHQIAGLTTRAGVFAKGCKDPVFGIPSTAAAYLGKTASGLYLGVQGATDHVSNLVAYATNPASLIFTSTTLATNVNPQVLGVDLNKDGFVDIIASGVTDSVTHKPGVGVFLGKGDGTYKAGVVYDMTTSATQPFIVDDVNGDGKADILVPNTTSGGGTQLTVLLGKGDGTFTVGPSTPLTLTLSQTLYGVGEPIATGDFNGDGKIDVLTADGKLYLGRGDGSFGAATQVLPVVNLVTTAYAVGDFNGDGKLDIAQMLSGVNASGTIIIFSGHGDGTFTQGFAYDSVPEGTAMAATDLDGDGYLDLVAGRASNGAFGPAGLGNQSLGGTWDYQILMGYGNGAFDAPPVTLASTSSFSDQNPTLATYTTADFNNDGRLDLLLPITNGSAGLSVSPGLGNGAFGTAIVTAIHVTPGPVAAADLDNDGKADAVTVGSGNTGAVVAVLFGNGDGTLGGELDYPLPAGAASQGAVVIGDFNGDGIQDIALSAACSSGCTTGIYVLFGQSNHTFSAPALINSTPALSDGANQTVLAVGDLNGDGRTDLVVANSGFLSGNGLSTAGVIHVYLGNANGTFTGSTPAVPPLYFTDLALADLNKDGRLDIVTGASDVQTNTQVDVMLGHGDGSFAAATQIMITGGLADPSPVIAVADFDGDGNPDVAFFLAGDFSGIMFGTGTGSLITQTKMPVFSPVFPGVPRAVDLNGDHRPDLMFADANFQGLVSLINQWGASSGGTAATSTTLTVTPGTATVGEAVTLTAKVTSNSAGTPTGTVSFLDGASSLGSSALSAQASATLTTTSLAAGTHALTAQYGGDSTFAASNATAVSLTVTGAKADFAIAASPTSGSAAAGASAATTVTLTPSGGFTGTVTLACSGLPTGASCAFSPSSVALSGSAASSDLTIDTTAAVARLQPVPQGGPFDPGSAGDGVLVGVMLPLGLAIRRRRTPRSAAGQTPRWVALLLIGAVALHGCGGGHGSSGGTPPASGGTPSGTYAVTVTATSGSTSHTASYSLTVT